MNFHEVTMGQSQNEFAAVDDFIRRLVAVCGEVYIHISIFHLGNPIPEDGGCEKEC